MPPVPPKHPDGFWGFAWTLDEIWRAKRWADAQRFDREQAAAEKAAREYSPLNWRTEKDNG
jgi:hypothetical protein